jgi:hypothetical protein
MKSDLGAEETNWISTHNSDAQGPGALRSTERLILARVVQSLGNVLAGHQPKGFTGDPEDSSIH